MNYQTTIPAELIACIAEINLDIEQMIHDGIDEDSVESIELLNNRITTLLTKIERSKAS